MAASDDDRFRPRPAPPRERPRPSAQRFVSTTLREAARAGEHAARPGAGPPASRFGRGRVAAAMAGGHWDRHARRVVVKSRFVVLRRASARSVAMHLRYIERDGVARDGQRGQAYGPATDCADLRSFEVRGRGDRHQFRFIVSVEDAPQLEDLRSFTRALMHRMARDLETPLDWVAVDHWDTDNPHTHVVLRGRVGEGSAGRDLVIAPGYMAHGMRMRASTLATEWLGPRTELEIRQGMVREVAQERLTSLDRALLRQAPDGLLDLRGSRATSQRDALLRARLQRLEALGVAQALASQRWRLTPDMAQVLAALGERGDIQRAVHRALRGQRRELAMAAMPQASVTGCILAKGVADELHERTYVVIDGLDGRAHHVRLPRAMGLEALRELPLGGIVELRPGTGQSADRRIAALARGGIYAPAEQLAELAKAGERDPHSIVRVHLRRLERLHRAGVVQRRADGSWQVPIDLVARGSIDDAREGARVALRSRLSLERQVRALGVTWLDREWIAPGATPGAQGFGAQGFGAQVRAALLRRETFLVEQGLAARVGGKVALALGWLSTLQARELAAVGRAMQMRSGQTYRPLRDGARASGIYRQRLELVSGRFAVLDDSLGFSLVPWRAALEAHRGQQLTALVQGGTVRWQWSRQRGMAR